jgi:hypothetical protein
MPAAYSANNHNNNSAAPVGALSRFARRRAPAQIPEEHCELCSAVIAGEHRHLLELASHRIICACDACALLFGNEGAGGGKYRIVPRRYLALLDFAMSDEQWDELMIPVNMVYIFRSTTAGRAVAFYPSPAGATESVLNLENWESLVGSNPILNDLEPDVEALLINRIRERREYYIVPIDACYRLVGLIRVSWRGLSGGEEAWRAIEQFFADLRTKSRPVKGEEHAGPEF